MCTGVLSQSGSPCTSGRFLAVKTSAQTFHAFCFIYPRYVMHVQAAPPPGTATTLVICSRSTALRSTSLTPVDVSFSVVRYS
jgi:hypothetical protein